METVLGRVFPGPSGCPHSRVDSEKVSSATPSLSVSTAKCLPLGAQQLEPPGFHPGPSQICSTLGRVLRSSQAGGTGDSGSIQQALSPTVCRPYAGLHRRNPGGLQKLRCKGKVLIPSCLSTSEFKVCQQGPGNRSHLEAWAPDSPLPFILF